MVQFGVTWHLMITALFALVTIWPRLSKAAISTCNRPIELVFMLDGSESVTPGEFIQQKAFVASQSMVYDIVPGDVRLGVLLYGSHVTATLALRAARDEHDIIARVVELIQPSDGNNIQIGIRQIRNMMRQEARKDAKKAIVLITDGQLRETTQTFLEADDLRDDGVDVYVIGVGGEVRESELFRLAGDRDHVMQIDDFGSLFTLTQRIRSSICPGKSKASTSRSGGAAGSGQGSSSSIWKALENLTAVPVPAFQNVVSVADSVEDVIERQPSEGFLQQQLLLSSIQSTKSSPSPSSASSSIADAVNGSSSLVKQFFTSDLLETLQKSSKPHTKPSLVRKDSLTKQIGPRGIVAESFATANAQFPKTVANAEALPVPEVLLRGDSSTSRSSGRSAGRVNSTSVKISKSKTSSTFHDMFKAFKRARKENLSAKRDSTNASNLMMSETSQQQTTLVKSYSPLTNYFFKVPGSVDDKGVEMNSPKFTLEQRLITTPTKYKSLFNKMVKIIKWKQNENLNSKNPSLFFPTSSTSKSNEERSGIRSGSETRNGNAFLTFLRRFKSTSDDSIRKTFQPGVSQSQVDRTNKDFGVVPVLSPEGMKTDDVRGVSLPLGVNVKKQFFSVKDSLLIPDNKIKTILHKDTTKIPPSIQDQDTLSVSAEEMVDSENDATLSTLFSAEITSEVLDDKSSLRKGVSEVSLMNDLDGSLAESVSSDSELELDNDPEGNDYALSSSRAHSVITDTKPVLESVVEDLGETITDVVADVVDKAFDSDTVALEKATEPETLSIENDVDGVDLSLQETDDESFSDRQSIISGKQEDSQSEDGQNTSKAPIVQYLTFSVTGTRPYLTTQYKTPTVVINKHDQKVNLSINSPEVSVNSADIKDIPNSDAAISSEDKMKIRLLDSLVKTLTKQKDHLSTSKQSNWKVRLSTILKNRLRSLKAQSASDKNYTLAGQTATKSAHYPVTVTKSKGACSQIPVGPEANFYTQKIGNVTVTRPCPLGTRFDTDRCRCIRRQDDLYRGCTSELGLDFDTEIADSSGKNAAVGDDNVILQNGTAAFDGGAKLTVWRFSSAYVGPELSIRFNVKPTDSIASRRHLSDTNTRVNKNSHQYLLGNCAPRQNMTYGIEIDTMNRIMKFAVSTDIRALTSVELPYETGNWNEVELRYGGLQLTGSVNGKEKSVALGGRVRSTGAPLSIGMCDVTGTGFTGFLDDVSIYFCNPGWEKRASHYKRANR